MKDSTEIHWEFTNSGSPQDTSAGFGTYKDMALAMVGWLKSTTMNRMIHIKVRRDALQSQVSQNGEESFEAMLAKLMDEQGIESVGDE